MNRSTPRTRAYEVLAAALEVKVATDVGDHDTACRALDRLRIALDAVLLDAAAQNLMEDGNRPEPLGRREAP